MLSIKTKTGILRIIPFGVIWFIFSIIYSLLEKGLLANLKYYPSTGNPYNFSHTIFITPAFAFITGLSIGAMEVFYFNKLFIQQSFTKKIFYKTVIYLSIIISFLLILTAISNSMELSVSVPSKQVWQNTLAFFLQYSFISVVVYIAAILIISQFYTEVSESIGQKVLSNFFTGKYHTPKEEERIFLFLDMKSSTTIAEKLGHVTYFEMLREYYADLSAAIVNHSGEIYQYVGDEVIVSWTLENGLQNNNCIECFFEMKSTIQKHATKYNERFGLLPQFKAGLHIGKVTTGEIGIIKKEIIFTGDVLNATSRIQGLCNFYKTDILISGDLIKELNINSRFNIKTLGENELKGRNEKIELFTILST